MFRLQWRSRENLGIINSQYQRRIIPGFGSYSDSMGTATKICSLKKHRLWLIDWVRSGIVRCSAIIQLNRVWSALRAHWTKKLNHWTYWIDVKCRHALHLFVDLPYDRMVRWGHRKGIFRNKSAHCKCVFNKCSSGRCYTASGSSQQGKTGPEITWKIRTVPNRH